jgi:hypothetical protein
MVMGEPPEQKSLSERNLYVTTPLMQRKDVDLSFVKLINTALSYNTEFRYANAAMFADEIKKISQAMLFVSTKSVDFGSVDVGGTAIQKFKIFNGGGSGDLIGEVRSKNSWIRAEAPTFRTQKRDVVLVADVNKVPRRNQVVRGQVEIVTKDSIDKDGQMLARADRWAVDCYIMVKATAARVVVGELQSPGSALEVRIRPGRTARLTFTLQNTGQMPAEGSLRPADPDSGVTVAPAEFCLKPDAVVSVVASIPPVPADTVGSRRNIAVDVLMEDQPVLSIPIVVIVESLISQFAGMFARPSSKKHKEGAETPMSSTDAAER